MSKIRKLGNSWMIDYYDPQGLRVRKCFKKKKDAEAELGKRVSLIAEGRYLDVKKDCVTTFRELAEKYEEIYEKQSSFKNFKKLCLNNFREHFGDETLLSSVRYVDLETYRNRLIKKPVRPDEKGEGKIRTIAAVNREMACLHHLFAKAVEWEFIERSPFARGKSLHMKENNARLRYLSEDEISRLLANCAPHLRAIVTCALNTGMRKGEILTLKWDQIRNGLIYLSKTKTDEPRQVPVNAALEVLFQEVRKKQPLGTKHVFTFTQERKKTGAEDPKIIKPAECNPINSLKTSFNAACRRAGIQNFKFHDLRHTFASQLVMRGATLKDVQELLGHKTMTMTLRYAHISPEHKKKAVDLLNGITAIQTDSWAKTGQSAEARATAAQLSP